MVKKKKTDKKADKGESEEELEENIEEAEEEVKKLNEALNEDSGDEIEKIVVKGSKPILSLKKGDKIKIDNVEFEIDAHYVLIDHGKTKEMAIDIFNPKTDKDYQLRYFSDQVETSMELYELEEIIYVRKKIQKVEW